MSLYNITALQSSTLSYGLTNFGSPEIIMPSTWGVRCFDLRQQMNNINAADEGEEQYIKTLGGFVGAHTSPAFAQLKGGLNILFTKFKLPSLFTNVSHSLCGAGEIFLGELVRDEELSSEYQGIVGEEIIDAVQQSKEIFLSEHHRAYATTFNQLAQLKSLRNLCDYPIRAEGKPPSTFVDEAVAHNISIVPLFYKMDGKPDGHYIAVYDSEQHQFITGDAFAQKPQVNNILSPEQRRDNIIKTLDAGIAKFTDRLRTGSFIER